MSNEYLNCCPKIDSEISGKKILIFGGSGSLGTVIVNRWISNNKIINISRNEAKQWELTQSIDKRFSENLEQYIGDISSILDVEHVILTYRPSIIIIAACLKHIATCEKFPMKSVQNNFFGINNVQLIIEKIHPSSRPDTVLFVSTDKACDPISTYGYSKALGESLIRTQISNTRYIAVRYGNVLNSSGSIIPLLQQQGKNKDVHEFKLTHELMTRFIMTLEQSVNLIEYALEYAKNGEIIIPHLYSMGIKDLLEIFGEKYKKAIKITGVRCREKIHEDLLSKSEMPYAYINPEMGAGGPDGIQHYIHISPHIQPTPIKNIYGICSSNNIINKKLLEEIIISLNFF